MRLDGIRFTLLANNKKIGPILAINNEDFNNQYVAEKLIRNLNSEKKIKISGIAENSKKVKKGYIFLQLKASGLMVKSL